MGIKGCQIRQSKKEDGNITDWSDYDEKLNFGKEVYFFVAELERRRD
jgi:hypothetical protein